MDYKKRPLWQWILLYVIIGGILYAIIYFVFIKGIYSSKPATSSNNPYGSSQNPASKPSSTTKSSSTDNAQAGSTPTNQPATPTQPPASPVQPAQTKSFTITADDSSADMESISVAKGTSVKLTFNVKTDTTYHGGLDFRSDPISTGTITPGSSKTIQFTADKSFSFTPYWPASNIQKDYTIAVNVT